MMKFRLVVSVIILLSSSVLSHAQHLLGPGEQPQLTLDSKGVIRIVYGTRDKIFFSSSTDDGKTFSQPQLVAEVRDMHLGMTRGPQLATSADYSIVTAMDKTGNIHAFRLTHKNSKWEKISNVNDVDASAPEGLMSISADDNNNFYAVWLDLREDRKNNICFSRLNGSKWSANKFAYKSPESHVCECCKPSIVAKGNTISIMFRNWLKGSRDLYLITSFNNGETFSNAQKLGNGTWPLQGCPMDGGGINIDSENQVHTAWQRDGSVFYAQPGEPEIRIGEGRNVGMSGDLITWQSGGKLFVKKLHGSEQYVADGSVLKVSELPGNERFLAVWEKDGQIFYNIH